MAISIGCVECEAASSSIHLYLHLAAEDRTRAVCGVECILASLYTEAVVVRSPGPGPGLCSLCPGAAAARTLSDHQFDTQPPAPSQAPHGEDSDSEPGHPQHQHPAGDLQAFSDHWRTAMICDVVMYVNSVVYS